MIKYTDLKSTNRHNLVEVLPLAKPFTVLIEPSSLCNFRCIQCFQSLKDASYFTKNRMNMPLSRFQRVVEQLEAWPGERHKVLKLSLYGEPFIHPQFCEMLRIARLAGVAQRIETTTNASLLSRDIAESLVEYQLDYLRVSIYASEQQAHNRITQSAKDIRIIRDNLGILQQLKRRYGSEKPFVVCKMLDAYGDENDRFKLMYHDVADELFIDKAHGWISLHGVDFVRSYYGEAAEDAVRDLQHNSTQRSACPMAFTTMAVRSNGAVSPCCVDFVGGTNLGNVDDSTLQEIWQSNSWYEFQKLQLQNRKQENFSCARCDIYRSNYYTRDNIDDFPIERLRAPKMA